MLRHRSSSVSAILAVVSAILADRGHGPRRSPCWATVLGGVLAGRTVSRTNAAGVTVDLGAIGPIDRPWRAL